MKNCSRRAYTLARAALAWFLCVSMVLTAVPTWAYAEVDAEGTPVFGDTLSHADDFVLAEDDSEEEAADEEDLLDEEGIDIEFDDEGSLEEDGTEDEEFVEDNAEDEELSDEAATVADLAEQILSTLEEDASAADAAEAAYAALVGLVTPTEEAGDVVPTSQDVLAGVPATREGVARTAYELLCALGLEADVISVADGSIWWNAVLVDNAWLHLDVFAGAQELEDDEAEAWLLLTNDELLERDGARADWTAEYGRAVAPEEAPAGDEQTAEDAAEVLQGELVSSDSAAPRANETDENESDAAVSLVGGEEPDADLVPQSNSYYAAIYSNGELRLSTAWPSSGFSQGWLIGSDNGDFPWRDYKSSITKVTVVDTIKVNTLSSGGYGMFDGMSNVTSMNLAKMDVSGCSNFSWLFWNCASLKTVNLSGWKMSSAAYGSNLFYGCSSLQTVKVGAGFRWLSPLPTNSINGHENWYSTKLKKWVTSDYIAQNRNNKADTYQKKASSSSTPTSTKKKRSINNKKVKVKIATQAWSGKKIKPNPTVKWGSSKLKKGRDYKIVKYGTNKKPGTKGNWVKIKGIGNYTGTRTIKFKIVKPHVAYFVHRQTYGWEKPWSKRDGASSGTTGQSKRLEGIRIKLTNKPVSGGIKYRTHIQSIGWESKWKANGAMSGTKGRALRLEAIQIKLTGNMAKKYDVWYCVHAQHYGWLGWAKNGAMSGTAKCAYRLESIKIKLLPKGSKAPKPVGHTKTPFTDGRTYHLKRDTWNFENFSSYTPVSYWQRCFGSASGYRLYNWATSGGYTNGYCYGFSTTVPSIVKHKYPKVSTFGKSKIYAIPANKTSSALHMTARQFVEYGYISQYDYRLMGEMYKTKNNPTALVNAVKSHIRGGTAIEIDLMGNGGHSVMPLDIIEDSSKRTVISIYDSNHPTQTQRFTLYKSGGRYVSWGYSDNLGYTWFAYETPADNFKSIMNGGGISVLDRNMKLVSATSNVKIVSGGKTYELSPDNTSDLDMVIPIQAKGGNGNNGAAQLYWVGFDTENMTVEAVAKDTVLTVSDQNSGVEIELKKGAAADLSVSDGIRSNVAVKGSAGDSFKVTYLSFDDAGGEPKRSMVRGSVGAKGCVTTSEGASGVDVSGGKNVVKE